MAVGGLLMATNTVLSVLRAWRFVRGSGLPQGTRRVWQREPVEPVAAASAQALGPDLGGQFREPDWLYGSEQVTHSEFQLT